MATAKQTKTLFKFPDKKYPNDAVQNSQWHPDNYAFWTAPKDWAEVRSETVAVSSVEALAMLERANPANAGRMRKSWITEFGATMNEGRFSLMDNIEFDGNGMLGNGEHRLRALAGSNAIVLLNVAYGRNPANYAKYDYNYKRSGGNIVTIWAYDEQTGKKTPLPKRDGDSISAGVSWCIYYWEIVALEERLKITPDMRIRWVTEHAAILTNLKTIRNYAADAGIMKDKDMPCAESILLALLTLGSEVNLAKTREFVKGVIQSEGTNWYAGSPVKVFREFLDNAKNAKVAKGKGRVYNSYKFGQGLYALRQFLDDKSIEKTASNGYTLRYKPSKGEKGISRLSKAHEESCASTRREYRNEKRNRLILLLNPNSAELSSIDVLVEGKFFSKTTAKGLAKMGVVNISDIRAFNEVALRTVLKSKSIDEIKDVFGALELTLKH